MLQKHMDISIIIPNYQSEHYLARCLASLQKHLMLVSHEIIIINNDPEPITIIAPTENIHILNAEKNNGFAGACNAAASTALGSVLFFLNPDTEIISGNLAELLTSLQDPTVGIVSPQLLTTSQDVQPWSAGYEITLQELLRNKFGLVRSKKLWEKNIQTQPDWTSGAALAIKRELFDKLGGFDENFFMYFEDVDLCKRVKKEGLQIISLPTIQILHIGGQSASSTREQKKCYYDSQDYYFKKHFGTFQLYLLKILRVFFLLLKRTQK